MTTESTSAGDNQNAPDDIKSKFREALEKKQQHRHHGNQAGPGGSKAQGAHRRADQDKTFRRKSG